MTKEEHINYWKSTAARDWKFVNDSFKVKGYIYGLFKDNISNHPPKIHNLVYIVDKTNLNPDEKQRAILEKMNAFQLEGRYPDYKNEIYKMCDKNFSENILKDVKQIRQWLLKFL